MKLFTRKKNKEEGWLVIDESPDELRFVRGRAISGTRGAVDAWAARGAGPLHGSLDRFAKEHHFGRYQCATLLKPGEYQVMMVEAPGVPPEELKRAIRWRIKDMLDYSVDEATLDVLDIPPERGSARGHSMFAVAAKKEIVEQRIKQFDGARIPLRVIDIPETAQRNIAALYEPENRGVALLYLERESSLLTINYQGELYFTRRLDIGFEQIMKFGPDARGEAFDRIQLELQRTFDHFDRQYSFISIAKLLFGPEPEDTGLAEFLGANLGTPVERMSLQDRFDIGGTGHFDAKAQWQLFHLVGASLRNETRAA